MDELQRGLVRDLHQVTDLLWRQGEDRWAAWLHTDRDLIRQGDIFGLDHLLSAFAGLGSINDVWMTRTNSFTPKSPIDYERGPDREQAANDTLQLLLRRIWERASLMRRTLRVRDHEEPDPRPG